MPTSVLAVIPARAGSKGLPGKCVAPLAGRPLIEHTILHARAARCVDGICVTTDSTNAAAVARQHGVFVFDRPPHLATDSAAVIDAVRHAVETYELSHPGFTSGIVVLLYANVPIRADGIIDRCIDHLKSTGCDSVRTVAPVGKHHPDWLHRLDADRMSPFRPNLVHRRQDLEPLYYHDAAVVAFTRESLYSAPSGPDDHHAFFGRDRRAIVQQPEDTVDIDTPLDLRIAEAILHHRARIPARSASEGVNASPGRLRADFLLNRPAPFIIAEAGVNHDGDLAAALQLVAAAARAGADAVKFQAFRADKLVSTDAAACDYQRGHADATTQHAMLRKLELPRAAFEQLKRAADDAGIAFLATPFDADQLAMLVDLGVPALKLASTDITNVPLLAAAARSGLPVIASTGAADLDEVRRAVAVLSESTAAPVLMHCVSRYPTPFSDANLSAIATLKREFGLPVGYSDHTREVSTGALAVAAGAVLLEKHLTLDRAAPGPDHFFSLTPDDFAAYVLAARETATALGDGRIACDPGQQEVRRLARRSIVAAAFIRRGERLDEARLDVQRPGGGIDPIHWPALVGRTAATDIAPGTRLDWAMLE